MSRTFEDKVPSDPQLPIFDSLSLAAGTDQSQSDADHTLWAPPKYTAYTDYLFVGTSQENLENYDSSGESDEDDGERGYASGVRFLLPVIRPFDYLDHISNGPTQNLYSSKPGHTNGRSHGLLNEPSTRGIKYTRLPSEPMEDEYETLSDLEQYLTSFFNSPYPVKSAESKQPLELTPLDTGSPAYTGQ